MVDEASSHAVARFAPENSTTENLILLRAYLTRFGRPACFRTHRLSLFRGNPRPAHGAAAGDEPGQSQIRRALAELDIEWSPTGPSNSGPAEDFFRAACSELGPHLQESGVQNLKEASSYLERVYLPLWRSRNANAALFPDAHRPLLAVHDLDSILSEVESRTISDQGAVQFHGVNYLLPEGERLDASAVVEIEKRGDGAVYLRASGRLIQLKEGPPREKTPSGMKMRPRAPKVQNRGFNRNWMQNFFQTPTPPLWRLLK
ncbi:MAG TPA: hypothetical protein VH639_25870 [Bryobacteraceae bacterium]|jgi:hypothetical protein